MSVRGTKGAAFFTTFVMPVGAIAGDSAHINQRNEYLAQRWCLFALIMHWMQFWE